VRWLRTYEPRWFRADLAEGLTPAAYLLPAALGDASLAGLSPEAELYACLFGVVVVLQFPAHVHHRYVGDLAAADSQCRALSLGIGSSPSAQRTVDHGTAANGVLDFGQVGRCELRCGTRFSSPVFTKKHFASSVFFCNRLGDRIAVAGVVPNFFPVFKLTDLSGFHAAVRSGVPGGKALGGGWLLSEIFPLAIRGLAMGLAVFVLWTVDANHLVRLPDHRGGFGVHADVRAVRRRDWCRCSSCGAPSPGRRDARSRPSRRTSARRRPRRRLPHQHGHRERCELVTERPEQLLVPRIDDVLRAGPVGVDAERNHLLKKAEDVPVLFEQRRVQPRRLIVYECNCASDYVYFLYAPFFEYSNWRRLASLEMCPAIIN
jgi:hypothetical protein